MKTRKFLNKAVQVGSLAFAAGLLLGSPARAQGQGAGGGTAGLQTAITTVNSAMEMLSNIAQTGVNIVIVPFGVGFALNIAKHLLRHSAS